MAKYSKNDIIRIVDEEDIEFIRLQFTDIFGTLKNVAQVHVRRLINRGLCEDRGVRYVSAPGSRHLYDFSVETTAGQGCTNHL